MIPTLTSSNFPITECRQAEGTASAEAEEDVREPEGEPEQPVVQHGADQLRHADAEGHEDHGGRDAIWCEGDEERVQEGEHLGDRGSAGRARGHDGAGERGAGGDGPKLRCGR